MPCGKVSKKLYIHQRHRSPIQVLPYVDMLNFRDRFVHDIHCARGGGRGNTGTMGGVCVWGGGGGGLFKGTII